MKNIKKNYTIQLASISGFMAVAIGAMGAHALKPYLSAAQIVTFETGVDFQFYHSLAMLAVGVLQVQAGNERLLTLASRLFFTGILCFSGSLYLLACRDIIAVPLAVIGPITPIGGLLFMAGWGVLFRWGWVNR